MINIVDLAFHVLRRFFDFVEGGKTIVHVVEGRRKVGDISLEIMQVRMQMIQ